MISVAAVLIIQAVTNSPLLAGNPNRDIPVFIVIAPIVLLRTGGIQTYPIKYCLADVELNFTFLATVIVPIAGIGFIKTKIAIVGIAIVADSDIGVGFRDIFDVLRTPLIAMKRVLVIELGVSSVDIHRQRAQCAKCAADTDPQRIIIFRTEQAAIQRKSIIQTIYCRGFSKFGFLAITVCISAIASSGRAIF